MRSTLVLLLTALAAVAEGAREPVDATTDEMAVVFVEPSAWRCAGSSGCVDCSNITKAATIVRLLGTPVPSEMAVRPGATLHICPQ